MKLRCNGFDQDMKPEAAAERPQQTACKSSDYRPGPGVHNSGPAKIVGDNSAGV